jgi:hypothetical protein
MKFDTILIGSTAQNFHTKCDTVANTLTIIKSTNGNIFGGFTEKAWDSSSGYVIDPKAFVFSLVNNENKPFKAIIINKSIIQNIKFSLKSLI